MATLPRDKFDEQPDDLLRVGAHRAPRKKGRGWVAFAWAALATVVLVGAGLYGLSRFTDGLSFDFGGQPQGTAAATPTPTATAAPVADPTTIDPARLITVTVLNGTESTGLQNTVGDTLAAAAWPVGARTQASQKDVAETFVYYSDPANEDVARGLVAALGIGDIRLSDAFTGAPVTVVLGADYVAAHPPA